MVARDREAADRIRTFCATIDAGLQETLAADLTMRLAEDGAAGLDVHAELPLFDSLKEAEHLRLGPTLGQGGMGLVREAWQDALQRDVAVKTVQPHRKSVESTRELFHEALVTGILEHPNIIPIYSLYRDKSGAPLIVMKRVEGVSWHACITRPEMIPDEGAHDHLGWHLQVFDEVCRATHFAHSRCILHRDIKPDNVMIGSHGEVYLLDWGIALTFDPAKTRYLRHISETRGVAGTPSYMAPEMAAADAALLSVATDVYLLGATLYHALAGRPPHEGETLHQLLLAAFASEPPSLPSTVPDELAKICLRAMAREPGERFTSAEELRRAVHNFREHRASIALSDEAAVHLEQLYAAVARGEVTAARRAFEQCRFGCEHAVKVWAANHHARALLDQALATMVSVELGERNLASAESLIDSMIEVPESLRLELDRLRSELLGEMREVEGLREIERQTSVQTGANYRTAAATVAWIFLTITPLTAEFGLSLVQNPMRAIAWHGVLVWAFLILLVIVFRRGLLSNAANRNITGVIIAFSFLVPLLRYVSWQTGLTVHSTVALEVASYTVGYAALGILSQFTPWFGVAVYAIAAVVGAHEPDLLYVATSVANFLALGHVVRTYRAQSS